MRRRALVGFGLLMIAGRARSAAPVIRVALQTAYGLIEMEVFAAQAPLSAAAFLNVVEAGDYGGGAFTRVVRPDNDRGSPPIAVVQGKAGRPAPVVQHESTRQTGLRHLDGTVSLPRDGVGTATGSEFFVCVGDQPALDFGGLRNRDGQGFAAFGRVTLGMDVVRRIWALDASGASTDPYTKGQMLMPSVTITAAGRIQSSVR